jgi:hypothetical protein
MNPSCRVTLTVSLSVLYQTIGQTNGTFIRVRCHMFIFQIKNKGIIFNPLSTSYKASCIPDANHADR